MEDLAQTDVLVLCGGLGKRLRADIGDSQKVLAPISGQPFLQRILRHLQAQGFSRTVLGTGYKSASVEEYCSGRDFGLRIEFCEEPEPLGTGGAVKHAISMIQSDPFFVLNGDSFCALDYRRMLDVHLERKSLITVLLHRVQDSRDYGTVMLDEQQRIISFKEKTADRGEAFVNAGIYCMNRTVFSFMPACDKFSLEEDFFPSLLKLDCFGYVTDQPFIDIGTPQRYGQAQHFFGKAENSEQAQQ